EQHTVATLDARAAKVRGEPARIRVHPQVRPFVLPDSWLDAQRRLVRILPDAFGQKVDDAPGAHAPSSSARWRSRRWALCTGGKCASRIVSIGMPASFRMDLAASLRSTVKWVFGSSSRLFRNSSASPANKIPRSSSRKQLLPGVCPGV